MNDGQIIELYSRADRYQDAMLAWLLYTAARDADYNGKLCPFGLRTVQQLSTNADAWHAANSYNAALYNDVESEAKRIIAEISLSDAMTVQEVAATYGIQSGTVRVSIHRGYIPARKSGKNWLIRRADAEARWGSRTAIDAAE